MAKKDKETDGDEPQKENGNPVLEALPETNEFGWGAPGTPSSPAPLAPLAPDSPQKIKVMNVSATLLHLEDGSPFPPRAIAELTQEEFDRFNRFGLVALK